MCLCFSISNVDFEKVKSRMGSISHRSKKLWYSSFIARKVWFIVVRGELRTCDTSKMELFTKMVYSLKSLTILTRSSILRSITGCWICLWYFFRFTFHLQSFLLVYFITLRLYIFFSGIYSMHTCIQVFTCPL